MKIGQLSADLLKVDRAEYDHCDLPRVMRDLSLLKPNVQNRLIKNSLGVEKDFDQLVEYVRQQFFILHQIDEDGKYSALGFGNHCCSVMTWEEWDVRPESLDDVNLTPTEENGDLKCERFLQFIEFWMNYYGGDLEHFLDGIEVATE